MLKRFVALFIAGLFFAFYPGVTVLAKTLDELKKEQAEIQSETKETKEKLQQTRNLKDITMRDIDAVDVQLNDITREIELIEGELEKAELLLEKTEEELIEAEEKRDAQYEVFKQRARYMYINGKMSYIDVIFKAESFSDLLKRFDYVNRVVKYDTELVQMLQEAEDAVSQKVEETQKHKDDLEVLQFEETRKKHSYEELRAEKAAQVVELDADEVKYLEMLNELEDSDKGVEKLIKEHIAEQERIAASQNRQIVYDYSGAQLQWPVPGRGKTSSGYVNRTNPISGRREFHTGLDIPAPYGTNIVAAEAGKVITAKWVSGYGNTVIIDHGNGMSTLYGHNSSLVVSQGDTVSRGQVIAKCGSTGYSTGNHCHFEVRIYGSTTNPNPYLGR